MGNCNCTRILCPVWDCMQPAIVATDKNEDTLTIEFYPNRLYNTTAVLLSGCVGCCCVVCASSVDTYVFNKKTNTCQVTKRYMFSTVREEYKDVLYGDVVRQQTYDGAKYFMVCVTKDQAHFLADSTGDLKRGIDEIREATQKFFGFERYIRGKDKPKEQKKKSERLSTAVDGKVKTGGEDEVELAEAKALEAAATSGKGTDRVMVKTLYPKLRDRSDGHVFRRYFIHKPAGYKKPSIVQVAEAKTAAGPVAQKMDSSAAVATASAAPQEGVPRHVGAEGGVVGAVVSPAQVTLTVPQLQPAASGDSAPPSPLVPDSPQGAVVVPNSAQESGTAPLL